MAEPGLYVHIPFCRSKCPYCSFYSIASTSLATRWIKAFERELDHYKGLFGCYDTLYIGGGTPTCIGIGMLDTLMNAINRQACLSTGAELTIEANPCDLTREMISFLKDAGFNRVSLGVQSFDDNILDFLGRNHSGLEAVNALEELRSQGLVNISIDLIYGLSVQNTVEWVKDLEKALSFRPEHISCYQLSIEKKTLFDRLRQRGELDLISEEEESEYFLCTSRFLEQRGYIHYEVSNFARNEDCLSRHNSKYWSRVPYLGLGPSAHSFDGTSRWWNVRSVKKYITALESSISPVDEKEVISPEQARLESLCTGIRTLKGFPLTDLSSAPEASEDLLRLQERGYIRLKKGRAVPTKKGFLVADRIALLLS